jgi:alkanesulfonate monooxygenase SsuD/methylene tetrahydromethanopterin reductase-like flavin-dependent oxidoreductase (luciferase family)
VKYWGFALGGASTSTAPGTAVAELLDAVAQADAAGLDGWFFPEHHGDPGHSLSTSPNLLIAAATQRTIRIGLGAMVAVVPFAHPLRMAEEIRFLDVLSGGRVEIGLGPGGFNEHLYWGVDPVDARAMFETGVQLIQRFLTESDFTYDTTWWRGQAPPLAGPPAAAGRRSYPPLWLATARDQSVESAARWGLNCMSAQSSTAVVAHRVELYRAAWEDEHPGNDPGMVGALADVVVHDHRAEGLRLGAEFHERKLARLRRFIDSKPRGFVRSEERRRVDDAFQQLTFAELVEQGHAICGDVDDCVGQVRRLRDTGVDVLTAWMPFGVLHVDTARRSLDLFCREVIPRAESTSR